MKSKLIQNRARAGQILGFDGLQWGQCRPTDLDLAIDFQGDVFVFGELKLIGNNLTMGQKYHLQGLVKAIRAGGKIAYAFLAHHDEHNTTEDVVVADAVLNMMYDGDRWQLMDETTTVKQFITNIHDGIHEE